MKRGLGLVGALGAALATGGAGADEPPAQPATPPPCPERLESARRSLAALEPRFVEKVYAPTLYETSSRNAEAERVLLPLLERTLKKAAADVTDLSLSLECRTWACKLLVLQPYRSNTAGWEKALEAAPELRERLRGHGVASRRRTSDTFGHEDLAEATVFFKLVDPSGQPRPPEARPAARAQPANAPPATPAECAAEVDKLEKKLAAMSRVMDRALTPPERFQKEPANEALTREMAARLSRAVAALPATFAGLAIECRGVVCQVRPGASAPLDQGAWQRLEARPELRARITGRAYRTEAYWLVRPAAAADGRAVLDGVLKQVEAQPFFEACHVRHPATGHLLVRYVLPGDHVFGKRGPRGPIRLEYSGGLADTPLARCIADELTRALATIDLPEERLHGHRERRYDWPRPP